MLVLGIDPGKRGGAALITDDGYPVELVFHMRGDKTTPGDQAIFIARCVDLSLRTKQDLWCYIENVHAMPKQGVSSTFEFGKGYGIWLGLLAAHDISTIYVSPQRWQKKMLTNHSCENTKDASVYCAKRLYPAYPLIPPGARVPSHGISDALLIAAYGLAHLGDD